MRTAREDHQKWEALLKGAAGRLGIRLPFCPGAWRKRGKTGLTWAQACRRTRFLKRKIRDPLCVHTKSFDPKAEVVAYFILEKPTSEVFAAFKPAAERLDGFEDIDWSEPNWAELDARGSY